MDVFVVTRKEKYNYKIPNLQSRHYTYRVIGKIQFCLPFFGSLFLISDPTTAFRSK
jgi:hypothetical protein